MGNRSYSFLSTGNFQLHRNEGMNGSPILLLAIMEEISGPFPSALIGKRNRDWVEISVRYSSATGGRYGLESTDFDLREYYVR